MWTHFPSFCSILFLGLVTIRSVTSSGFVSGKEKNVAKSNKKGDPGLLLGSGKLRPGRDTYRYYGGGAKGM